MSSIYIHIPFCKRKCHYCNFYSTASTKNRDQLIDSIIKEINFRSSYLANKKLESIYFGGGTPSLLTYDEFFKIFNAIKNNFTIHTNCEITLEANPDDINKASIILFRSFLNVLISCA